jgi:hypothetical protein
VNRKLVIPVSFAAAASVSGTVAKKLALVTIIGIGAPTAGYHFVQAVVSSRAHALSQIEEHRNAPQSSHPAAAENQRDIVDDLRAAIVVASQMKDRHDVEATRQSVREASRVLQRAELASNQFKARLTKDQTVSDDEIQDMERMDKLSRDLRAVRLQLLQTGG